MGTICQTGCAGKFVTKGEFGEVRSKTAKAKVTIAVLVFIVLIGVFMG
jgi:hypothetical protein